MKKNSSGNETDSDYDSDYDSDFEVEAPTIEKTRKQIMPGARLRMMRR
jgi:hypothetical protein